MEGDNRGAFPSRVKEGGTTTEDGAHFRELIRFKNTKTRDLKPTVENGLLNPGVATHCTLETGKLVSPEFFFVQ